MSEHGGFEGNAQSLRILCRLEKKATSGVSSGDFSVFSEGRCDLRCGLNLTYRTLASVLKYDRPIPERSADREDGGALVKGYYLDDQELVRSMKQRILGDDDYSGPFKTIECSIMDIADDIAYSTYDLEDNFKAGFLTPMSLFALDENIYKAVAETINKRGAKQYQDVWDREFDAKDVKNVIFSIFEDIIFGVEDDLRSVIRSRDIAWSGKKMMAAAEVQALSSRLAGDGYHRTKFTSGLVQFFLQGVEIVKHPKYPQLHSARLDLYTFIFVEVLKNVTFHSVIQSSGLQVVEHRGKNIVRKIFHALNEGDGIRLLPDDFRFICKNGGEMLRKRTICDFIAGMTDRYAFEFYGRLYGTNHLTVHKPL